jgi:hypothetical protein
MECEEGIEVGELHKFDQFDDFFPKMELLVRLFLVYWVENQK